MIKLLLMSKNQTTKDGRSFKKFFTSADVIVKGEEEKGLQKKSLTVRFEKTIDTSKFVRGILTVKEDKIEMPYKYEIREVEKNGVKKLRYPSIYIKEVIEYEPRQPKSTIHFNLLDETETEEVDIPEDEEDEETENPF